MKDNPVLALTPGEPAGIGPDICLQLGRAHACRLVLIGDPTLLGERAAALGLPWRWRPWQGRGAPAGDIEVVPVETAQPVRVGRLDAANAGYVLQTLERAVAGCLDGEFDALVTAPVHKGILNDAGIAFSGHTEFLAARAGVQTVVMMLTDGDLRVALATTHLPLADVSRRITPTLLTDVLRVLHRELHAKFGIADARILVCGLNPHAGESGHCGREEIEIIAPVIARLQSEGMRLRGPVPADTAFTPVALAEADAVLAMYHDQGLPVLKARGFGQAVNVTLGLPFVRTSVDHGTALELAGSGRADTGSLSAAVELALHLARP